MKNPRYMIQSDSYSSFVLQAMKSATAAQKKEMDHEDIKWFASEAKMKDFAFTEPKDRLDIMLIKLGYTIVQRVAIDQENADHIEFLSINQYQFPELNVEVAELQAEHKIHYLTSQEILFAMQMCARNIHSPIYKLSSSITYLVKRMKDIKKTKIPYHEQVNEAGEAVMDLNALLLAQLNSLSWSIETLGLEANDLRILSTLFSRRYGAFTTHEIAEGAMMEGKMTYLKKNVDRLKELKLIRSDEKVVRKVQMPGKDRRLRVYYMITDAGVVKMMSYLKHISSMAFKIKD